MDPPIEAFIPTKIFTEESDVESKDLQQLIKDVQVADAVLVYRLLEKNKIEVPADIKQSFFELICFYNSDEPLDADLVEERWFTQNLRVKERQRKTWKDHDLAEQIFQEIEPKDSRAFSTIIRGMAKFCQVEKAWALYNDALARNIELDVEAFNSVLSVANFLKESAELRWDLLLEILTSMKTMKVAPNLGTMNACLETISHMNGPRPKEYALKVLAEFHNIGVEPSLASWFHVLQTFCKDRGPVSHVLVDILNLIDGKEFQIRDIKDTYFFVQAMEVCRIHLHDKNLAKRLDALLHLGDNYNLIGDSFRESIYYRHFTLLMIETEPLETFMQTYNTLVPNVYIPEPAVMDELLKAVEVSGAIEHIPLLWSHMVLFDHITREDLLTTLLRTMVENKPSAAFPQQEHLPMKFADIAFDLWSKIQERNEMRSKPIVWTAKLLCDIIKLQCKIDEYDRATQVFDNLVAEQHKILGDPEVSALQDFVQVCISKKNPSKAIHCLQVCTDIGFPESREIAKLICVNLTLDENHLRKVSYLVGEDVVREAEEEKRKASAEATSQQADN